MSAQWNDWRVLRLDGNVWWSGGQVARMAEWSKAPDLSQYQRDSVPWTVWVFWSPVGGVGSNPTPGSCWVFVSVHATKTGSPMQCIMPRKAHFVPSDPSNNFRNHPDEYRSEKNSSLWPIIALPHWKVNGCCWSIWLAGWLVRRNPSEVNCSNLYSFV